MKAEEIRNLKTEELDIEVENLRKRQFELRCQSVTEKLENPRELRKLRRDVARVLTEKRARQNNGSQS